MWSFLKRIIIDMDPSEAVVYVCDIFTFLWKCMQKVTFMYILLHLL